MHKLLDNVTATLPTGIAPQRKAFKLKAGSYTGRLAALYKRSAAEIVLRWSDPPYRDWSTHLVCVNDAADLPFSAVMDSGGHIHIVYSRSSSIHLAYLKMTFSAGNWLPGATRNICQAGACYYPAIAKGPTGELWSVYTYFNLASSKYTLRAKVSYDDGTTWGSGPSDPGDILSSENEHPAYGAVFCAGLDVYCLYCEQRSALKLRRQSGTGGVWDDPLLVFSGNFVDSDFDWAVAPNSKVGIAFCCSGEKKVYFREFDGEALGGLQSAALFQGRAPQLLYLDGQPHIFYARALGNGLWLAAYAYRTETGFAGGPLLSELGLFQRVKLYHHGTASLVDRTAEAASAATSDVYHPSSNGILAETGDCLYLGHPHRFFCVDIVLSAPGGGGTVIWEYYDGSQWRGFVPVSGNFNFDQASSLVYLWSDSVNIPSDWQPNILDNETLFWVRARVVSNFVNRPVGSQIAAAAKTDHLVKLEEVA